MSAFAWSDMELVLSLCRAGSLLEAGRQMGVNASTMGRRLDALEERLGVRIFDRTRKGVLMTRVAEQMLPFAESAEQAAAGFLRVVEGYEQEAEGLVRITAPPGIASVLLGAWVGKILRDYPRLQIQVDAEVGYADLSRREADIALRVRRPTRGDLVAVLLGAEAPKVMASPGYVEQLGVIESWEQLTWLTWGPGLSHLADGLWLEQKVEPGSIALRSDSIEVQLQAARSGLGAVWVAEIIGYRAGLCLVPLSEALCKEAQELPEGQLWMVGHRALRDVPRIAAVWRSVLGLMEEYRLSRPQLTQA